MRCGEVCDLFLSDVYRYMEPDRTQHVIYPRTCRHDQLPAYKHALWRINLQVYLSKILVQFKYTYCAILRQRYVGFDILNSDCRII